MSRRAREQAEKLAASSNPSEAAAGRIGLALLDAEAERRSARARAAWKRRKAAEEEDKS